MKKKTKSCVLPAIIILGLLLTCSANANALWETLQPTKQYTVNELLSDNGVTFIFEDSRGYVWVGTFDGLNRFDGYEIQVIKNGLSSNVLASNRVRSMNEDHNGNLWIGTDEGITVYNYSQDKFSLIYTNSQHETGKTGPVIRQILVDKTGKIYCITQHLKILIFNSDFTLDEKIIFEPNQNMGLTNSDATWLNDETIIIAAQSKIIVFDIQAKTFRYFFRENWFGVNCIEAGNNNTLYIGEGPRVSAYRYEIEDGRYKLQLLNVVDLLFTSESSKWNYTASALELDELGNLWIGTMTQGLYHIKDIQSFNNNMPFQVSKYGAPNDFIRISSISSNILNNCWVGTFNIGVLRFSSELNPFIHLTEVQGVSNELANTNIETVIPYDTDKAMLFTVGGGINLLNTTEKNIANLPFLEEENAYGTGLVDSRKNLWISSTRTNNNENLILRYKTYSNKPEVINEDTYPGFTINNVFVLCEDYYGNIWLGDNTEIFKIEVDGDGNVINAQSVFSNPFFAAYTKDKIRAMEFDRLHKFLWVGSQSQGLLRFDLQSNPAIKNIPVKAYRKIEGDTTSLSSNFVTDISLLPDSSMWISTEQGGICKVLDRANNATFEVYSEEDGLSSNNVKSIQYDNHNTLWVATNKGLDRFHIKQKTFRKFNDEDGLYLHSFTSGGAQLDNGTIVIPSREGMCFFDPGSMPNTDNIPQITFRDFYLNNKKVFPGDTINHRILLPEQISELETLNLKYNENIFAIEVVSLHYGNPLSHIIKYRLSPLDKEWVETTSDKHSVFYSGIQPGNYTFEAMASNTGGEWSEPISIEIVVRPPYWKTWWFRIIWALIVVFISYMFYRRRIKKMKQDHAILQERIRESVAELEKSKQEMEENKKEVEIQREELKRRDEEEKEIRFHNEGLVRFSQIIGDHDDLGSMCQLVISELIRYLGAQMGIIYIITDDEDNPALRVMGSHACNSNQINQHDIAIGEGNVGTCFKVGKLIEMENIPHDYVSIASGLGEIKPAYVCFIPLVQNDNKSGIIELASFTKLEDYKIDFVRKLGESITATVLLIKFIAKNNHILEQATQQAEELRAQDEELRQNLEEMQATQEELNRLKQAENEKVRELTDELAEKNAAYNSLKKKLGTQVSEKSYIDNMLETAKEFIYFKNLEGEYTRCGKSFIRHLKLQSEEDIIGRSDMDVYGDKYCPKLREMEQKTMETNMPVQHIINREKDNGEAFFEYASVMPLLNSEMEMIGIWAIRTSLDNKTYSSIFAGSTYT